jgi:hypothetical protein
MAAGIMPRASMTFVARHAARVDDIRHPHDEMLMVGAVVVAMVDKDMLDHAADMHQGCLEHEVLTVSVMGCRMGPFRERHGSEGQCQGDDVKIQSFQHVM